MDNRILGVSLADYASVGEGAGEMSYSELAELQKALNAGQITGRETTGLTDQPGATLKVESLENTLKSFMFKESDVVLWKTIEKKPAFNTVEEFNQQREVGTDGYSFTNEGDLPEDDSPIYVRQAELVKFMGTTRSVSHPMTLVNTMIGNVVQKEIENGTLKILRDVDKAMLNGDADMIPQEFNSFKKQQQKFFGDIHSWYNSDLVVDLRGAPMTEKIFEEAALKIVDNHGDPNLFMAPPRVLSKFTETLYNTKRIVAGSSSQMEGVAGQKFNQFLSQYGLVDLKFDKFMKGSMSKSLASTKTSLKAPSAPIADATTPKAAVADASLTKFLNFDGDYYYAVSAINRYGESELTNLATAAAPNTKVSVAATESVDLKFAAGTGPYAATAFIVYRTKKGATANTAADAVFYPIFKVSAAQLGTGYDGADAGFVRDRNKFLPDTETSFMIDSDPEIWAFKQLAPLMKMDLAVIAPAFRFMLLLYGTPILYVPTKMVHFVNVGGA